MDITSSIVKSYQIHEITNQTLIVSRNLINNIAIRILKYIPLITSTMIPVGIVFSLENSVEGAVLRNETMTMQEFDEIDHGAYDIFSDCGPFTFSC